MSLQLPSKFLSGSVSMIQFLNTLPTKKPIGDDHTNIQEESLDGDRAADPLLGRQNNTKDNESPRLVTKLSKKVSVFFAVGIFSGR